MFGLASHWLTSSVSNLCKWVEVTGNEPALPSLGFNHALKATQTIRINKKISVRGGGHCGKGGGDGGGDGGGGDGGGGDGGCVKCWRWWWWFRKHLGVCVPHPLGQLIIICRPATALSQPAPSASYLFVSFLLCFFILHLLCFHIVWDPLCSTFY